MEGRAIFLMHYYVSESDSLEVKYVLKDGVDPKFNMLEYSLDLLSNDSFTVTKRPKKYNAQTVRNYRRSDRQTKLRYQCTTSR